MPKSKPVRDYLDLGMPLRDYLNSEDTFRMQMTLYHMLKSWTMSDRESELGTSTHLPLLPDMDGTAPIASWFYCNDFTVVMNCTLEL